MNEKELHELSVLLAQPKKIAIIPHRNPDGDAMGSTLGLSFFLRKMGHQTQVVAPNDFPAFLAWLPGSEEVMVYENNRNEVGQFLQSQDLIFTLDFNALHRIGEMEQVVQALTAPKVMIDHHEKPDTYAAFTFSSTTYGSTCQMVYDFIQDLNLSHYINKDVANCLYTGIATGSGGFRFKQVFSARVHIRIA